MSVLGLIKNFISFVMCEFILMPMLFALSTFEPHFTADKLKSATYFLFFSVGHITE